MSATFTPGPWKATERHGYREIIGPRPRSTWYGRQGVWAVAYIDTDLDEEVQDANAELVAAAPELLDQLEKMVAHYVQLAGCGDCGNWDPEAEDEVIAARAVIAKAGSVTKGVVSQSGDRA